MLRRAGLLFGLLASTCATTPVFAQYHHPRYVVVEDAVRDYLAREWDRHLVEVPMTEHGHCLRWDLVSFAGETAYHVYAISKPESIMLAAASSIAFRCAPGPDVAEIHTHPPQSCMTETGPCVDGGWYAHQCFASPLDAAHLRWLGQAFGLVQCDRHALVFYFPESS
jgi:hypothetical protein